jgi:hypothetical protein
MAPELDNEMVLIRDTKNRRPHMLALSDFLSDMLKRLSESRTAIAAMQSRLLRKNLVTRRSTLTDASN